MPPRRRRQALGLAPPPAPPLACHCRGQSWAAHGRLLMPRAKVWEQCPEERKARKEERAHVNGQRKIIGRFGQLLRAAGDMQGKWQARNQRNLGTLRSGRQGSSSSYSPAKTS